MIVLDNSKIYYYEYYGSCNECKLFNTDNDWCQFCNAKHFRQDFKNWTSGNCSLDEFILSTQLKADKCDKLKEWIEYKMFKNVEYLIEEEFEITYRAIWKNGQISNWDSKNNQWKRNNKNFPVILKCFHKSQNITKYLKNVCIFL